MTEGHRRKVADIAGRAERLHACSGVGEGVATSSCRDGLLPLQPQPANPINDSATPPGTNHGEKIEPMNTTPMHIAT